MTTAPDLEAIRPTGVFDRVDFADGAPHEQVVFCSDDDTGLKAIIAIHSTTLGPALGGSRFYDYVDEQSALTDVLRLSRGMTHKAAVAGLPLGGGKAVILGNPLRIKSDALLRAFGRFVHSLHGRYITAGDMGTTSEDMDVIGETTDHVVARTQSHGGSGDSAPMTALGVFRSIEAAALSTWGSSELAGRRVGVEGAGKVGSNLASLLADAEATVLVSDVSSSALTQLATKLPAVQVVEDVTHSELDIYAPCAMGGSLTHQSATRLNAQIVCGAANNQLADNTVERVLCDRGIIWVPDYVANGGGLIQVAGEIDGRSRQQMIESVDAVATTVAVLLARQRESGLLAGEIARRLAEERIAAARAANTAAV